MFTYMLKRNREGEGAVLYIPILAFSWSSSHTNYYTHRVHIGVEMK
jgi:hypothetical protein